MQMWVKCCETIAICYNEDKYGAGIIRISIVRDAADSVEANGNGYSAQ